MGQYISDVYVWPVSVFTDVSLYSEFGRPVPICSCKSVGYPVYHKFSAYLWEPEVHGTRAWIGPAASHNFAASVELYAFRTVHAGLRTAMPSIHQNCSKPPEQESAR